MEDETPPPSSSMDCATPAADEPRVSINEDETSVTRLRLVWEVLFFQMKLAADGIKELWLSPCPLSLDCSG
jgi:hypothetical protein